MKTTITAKAIKTAPKYIAMIDWATSYRSEFSYIELGCDDLESATEAVKDIYDNERIYLVHLLEKGDKVAAADGFEHIAYHAALTTRNGQSWHRTDGAHCEYEDWYLKYEPYWSVRANRFSIHHNCFDR